MWSLRSSADKQAYLPVVEVEETEKDGMISGRPNSAHDEDTHNTSAASILRSPWLLHIVAFTCYSAIFGFWSQNHFHESCVKKHSLYSPALEAVSEEYKTIRWNLSATQPSEFTGKPSKELDAAWSKYVDLGAIVIPYDEIVKINASRYSTKVPKEVGDGYMAHVEWYHQLHCVYMLWQQTYPEWYTDEAEMKEKEPELWHEHLDHCAETLRTSIMCHADANIVPSNWVKNRHWPHPNYNLDHKCRDFDAAYQWAMDNQANPPPGFEMFARPEEGGYHEYPDLPFDPFDVGTEIPLKEKSE